MKPNDLKFLDEVKKELRPKDLALNEADMFIEKVNILLRRKNIRAKCVKGGSTAKGTFLKDDHDVDLFVIFDYSYKKKDISKVLLEAVKSLIPEVIHGSRDYLHVKKKGMTYEIIPVLEVKDVNGIENVTDMSPHHVEWVNKRLNDTIRDEIRLAKRFCKAQKIYGAESYISGFSGHVIDILIIYYGGFLNLLKAAKNWTPKVVIDFEHHWVDPLKSINDSKSSGPLIVVDPVQPERNASAAISLEKFGIFVKASREFLKNPSKDFFRIKEFDADEIRKREKRYSVVTLIIAALDGKTDVVGAKLLKIFQHVKKQLDISGFTVLESDWKWDKRKKCEMYFIVKEKILPKTFVRVGPPNIEVKSCIAFKVKNDDVFEKNRRLYANVLRKERTAKGLVKSIVKQELIKGKAKEIRVR